jgi:hypothetical protein
MGSVRRIVVIGEGAAGCFATRALIAVVSRAEARADRHVRGRAHVAWPDGE